MYMYIFIYAIVLCTSTRVLKWPEQLAMHNVNSEMYSIQQQAQSAQSRGIDVSFADMPRCDLGNTRLQFWP